MTTEPTMQEPIVQTPRNFQIPGCDVHICSGPDGVTIEELLSIIFNVANSNPSAIVDFGVTVRGGNAPE